MKRHLILLFVLVSIFNTANVFSQPMVGKAAPAISGLKMITQELPDLGNKYVYLDFWATYSAPEVASLSHLNSLAQRYKNKVVFLAVSDENEEKVRGFLNEKNWNNIFFGLDIDQILKKNFSIEEIPVFYLISPQKTILVTGNSYGLSDHDLDSIIVYNDTTMLSKPTKIAIPIVRKKK